MLRTLAAMCLLVTLVGCDEDPPPIDTGPPPPPRTDSGPFVCPDPALPAPPTPGPALDRPTELVLDRDTADGSTVVAFDADAVAEDARFDLGVQAGSIRRTSARLWTHATAMDPITLRVWRDDGDEVRLANETTVTPVDGGYVLMTVEGLAPATGYRYAFFVGTTPDFTGRSTVGRFTTAIPEGTEAHLRVAATTCTNQARAPFESLSWMAEQDVDLFVQLGDMVYNDGARTRAEFRSSWRSALSDPGYLAMLSNAGAYYTWDDHEIIDSGGYYDIPESVRQAGTDAFYENLPVEPVDRDGSRSFWNAYPWGDSVEFIVLDARSERQVATRETPDAEYLSEAQLSFLFDRLENSPARFKVVLNSVPITRFPLPLWGFQDDRWQGYDAQRTRLVDFIAERNVRDVVFLTGDFHLGFVARIEPEGAGHNVWEVAVGPGDSRSRNPVPALVSGGVITGEEGFPCAQFAYFDGATRAATLLDFDSMQGTLRVQFIEPVSENVLFDGVLFDDAE
ncbi:MAG: alkaline phosphatase [Sandaracinaceae bacterium]